MPPDFLLSVNLAARQLLGSELTGVVEGALGASGLDPRHLCFEITESVLLDDGEASARALTQLKSLGVRIAVDDFGTGFSALTYLKRFPVDELKIDRSFVVGLGRDREDRAIVAGVVDLANALGLLTVAEGVETAEQLAELRALGCERAQGYLWSRPMPREVAAQWITAHSRTAPVPGRRPADPAIRRPTQRPGGGRRPGHQPPAPAAARRGRGVSSWWPKRVTGGRRWPWPVITAPTWSCSTWPCRVSEAWRP